MSVGAFLPDIQNSQEITHENNHYQNHSPSPLEQSLRILREKR